MLENKREMNKYLSAFYLHHSKQTKLGKLRARVNVATSEMVPSVSLDIKESNSSPLL